MPTPWCGLPRQPGGSATIAKETTWLPLIGPQLPVSVPDIVAMFEPGDDYPERWSVVRSIEGEHPQVISPDTPVDVGRQQLARNLVGVLRSLERAQVPQEAVDSPDLRWNRGDRWRRSTRRPDATSSAVGRSRTSISISTPRKASGMRP
jgi:aminoglycoside phosphotransferase (APT) family kinase protein